MFTIVLEKKDEISPEDGLVSAGLLTILRLEFPVFPLDGTFPELCVEVEVPSLCPVPENATKEDGKLN